MVGEVLGTRLRLLQLGGALGDRALEGVARCLERLARGVLGRYIVVDPNRAGARLRRVNRLADELAPEGAAVLAPVLPLGGDGVAVAHLLVPGGIALELLARAVNSFGALADELARPVAEHLLETLVAALIGAVAHEGDAHRRVVEDRLLLAQEPRHLVGLPAPLGDVLDDPHRAALRVGRIDCLRDQAAKKGAAVLAPHLPLDVELAAGGEDRHGDLAKGRVALAARIDDLARLADELVRAIAEHLGELRIGEKEAPLARERDADRSVGEQRLVLELRVARTPRVRGCRALGPQRRRRLVQLAPRRGFAHRALRASARNSSA